MMTVIMVCKLYWSKCDINHIIQKLLIHIRQFTESDIWLNSLLKLFSVKLEPSSGTRGNSRPAVPGSEPSAANNGRPSKRHGNAHKREKLRRTFVHLDAWNFYNLRTYCTLNTIDLIFLFCFLMPIIIVSSFLLRII